MIRPPKALTVGATDHGEFKLLYCGDDVVEGMKPLDHNPPDVHHIWFFRSGQLRASRECEAARVIRAEKLAAAEKLNTENAKKLAEQRESDRKKSVAEQSAASRKASEEARKRDEASAQAKAKSDAEILTIAAQKAAARSKPTLASATEPATKP